MKHKNFEFLSAVLMVVSLSSISPVLAQESPLPNRQNSQYPQVSPAVLPTDLPTEQPNQDSSNPNQKPSNISDNVEKAAEESSYDRYMRLGYSAAQKENYELAASYFRNALYEVPQDRDATIAYWNTRNVINERQDQDSVTAESDYDRSMEKGYDATAQGDYQMALKNFNQALVERPEDYYATQAIRNVQTYLNRGEEISPKDSLSIPILYVGERPYDRYMRLGYAAQKREDYTMAMSHFRSALYERPNDRQATIAFWNIRDSMNKDEQTGTEQESSYDRYMRLGYDATEQENYPRAINLFQQALNERPNDQYAAQAILNVKTYSNQETSRNSQSK